MFLYTGRLDETQGPLLVRGEHFGICKLDLRTHTCFRHVYEGGAFIIRPVEYLVCLCAFSSFTMKLPTTPSYLCTGAGLTTVREDAESASK